MDILAKYREIEEQAAVALGWTVSSRLPTGEPSVWRNPQGFYGERPPRYTNEDALCFDLMHDHKIWVWQNPGDTDFMAEYMVDGVKAYHLEYGRAHHSSKIAMRCAILNALVKLLKGTQQ